MINIAFDTNTWLNFIENQDFKYIETLSDNVFNEKIQIILPINIEKEFYKEVGKVEKKVLKNNSSLRERTKAIIKNIEQIFNKSYKLPVNETGLFSWVNSGIAPNHNKQNFEDTLILISLLSLPKNFTFYLASNDSDFRKSKNEYDLHPAIVSKFEEKSINVKFYTCYKKLSADIKLSNKQQELLSYELYDWSAFKLEVKNKSIFEQLTATIDYYYKELSFIPRPYLKNIYPINIGDNDQTYFDGLTLSTNNKNLFNFLKDNLEQIDLYSARIKDNDLSDAQILALTKALNILNKNLVLNISHKKETLSININKHNEHNNVCQCLSCLYSRNEVKKILEACTISVGDTPSDLLNKAYYLYRIRHLNEALEITNIIVKKVDKNDKPIIHFISRYNKDILSKMWFEGGEDFEIERKKIKSDNENKYLKSGISSIIGYLKYSKYFDFKLYELFDDFDKIKNRYEMHNGYGESFYSNIDWKNIIRWAELIETIEKNGIFFDYYSNMRKFAKYTLLSSLYASLDRRVKFSIHSLIIQTTPYYIETKELKKILNSLKIDKLNCNKQVTDEVYEIYYNKVKNLNQSYSLGLDHSYFKIHLGEIEKSILIQSYLSFTKQQDNKIISTLLNYASLNDYLNKEILKMLTSFLINKIENINRENALRYLDLTLNSKLDFDSNLTCVFRILKHFKSIPLKQSYLKILLNRDIHNQTGYYRDYIFSELLEISTVSQKEIIYNSINDILNNENSFDFILYSFLSEEKKISRSELYHKKYVEYVQFNINSFDDRKLPDSTDSEIKRNKPLDYYINHVYQMYPDQNESLLSNFKGYSPYYDFLIDPDNFNLKQFNIHWFYIATINSFPAINFILNNFEKINNYIIDEILKKNNSKYLNAFIKAKREININKFN